MIKSPCFDEKTRTDCPRRHVGCAIDCPEWAKYTEEREKEYRARIVKGQVNSIVSETGLRRSARTQKRMLRIMRVKR